MVDDVVDETSGDGDGDGDVKGAHDGPQLFPMLAQVVATQGQKAAPPGTINLVPVEVPVSKDFRATEALPLDEMVTRLPVVAEMPDGLDTDVRNLRGQLARLGPVNLDALAEVPPFIAIPIPMLLDIPRCGFVGERTKQAVAQAAAQLQTCAFSWGIHNRCMACQRHVVFESTLQGTIQDVASQRRAFQQRPFLAAQTTFAHPLQ